MWCDGGGDRSSQAVRERECGGTGPGSGCTHGVKSANFRRPTPS
jgi:hypothetical protein